VTEEIHDMSRVDSFMASRRRAMFFHSVWKPMLAGAVGAAIMAATVIGSVWVILPKISTREVVVDHVIQHDKPFDLPVPMPKPQTSAKLIAPPDMGPQSPYAAKTPDENKFVDKPEYKTAKFHGRIVKSRDGHELSFEDGTNFWPGHWDDATGKVVNDPDHVIPSDQFIGDLGMCVPNKAHPIMWDCTAMHDGKVTYVSGDHNDTAEAVPQPSESVGPTPAAAEMVMVDVVVGSYPVEAMVDTGCSFPMSVPRAYADALIRLGLATTRARPRRCSRTGARTTSTSS
jgi:hypothetical protein